MDNFLGTTPQLYADLYFGSHDQADPPQDTSRLTHTQHASVCSDLFNECLVLRQNDSCYAAFVDLATQFQKARQSLIKTSKEIEKRTYANMGSDWAWEYKLRSSPLVMRRLHHHLHILWQFLMSVKQNMQQTTVAFTDEIIPAQGALKSLDYIIHNLIATSNRDQIQIFKAYYTAKMSDDWFLHISLINVVHHAGCIIKQKFRSKASSAIDNAMIYANINRIYRLCHQRLHVIRFGGGADAERPAASFSGTISDKYSENPTEYDFVRYRNEQKVIAAGEDWIPPPPVDCQCQFCGIYVDRTCSISAWRKHLEQDLQPYFCLHPDCCQHPVRVTDTWFTIETFETPDDWTDHMRSYHGYKDDSYFTECPFCDEHVQEDYAQLLGMPRQDDDLSQGPIQGLKEHIGWHMWDMSVPVLYEVAKLEESKLGKLIEYPDLTGLMEEERG